MCFVCCYNSKPTVIGFFGILANGSIRLKIAFKVDAMHVSRYRYCIVLSLLHLKKFTVKTLLRMCTGN